MDRKLIQTLKEIIVQAGEISLNTRHLGLIIEKKSDNSPVTNADLKISDFIYKGLTKLNKDIPVICEEQPSKQLGDKNTFWLVDPIDGTKSYIKNMDSFTVNIALIKDGHPVIGLIYIPALRKLYFTDHQGKLCIEQDGIKINPNQEDRKDFVAVVSSNHFNTKTEEFILKYNFSKVISIPSSIKFCMIAENSCDIYPKFGQTMEWDVAAGHALINAAGGVIVEASSNQILSYNKTNFENSHFLAMNKRCFTEYFNTIAFI